MRCGCDWIPVYAPIVVLRRVGTLLAVLVAASALVASAAAATWRPPQDLSWYWQLAGTVDNSHGAAAYDIDGFDNSAAEVAALHAMGKHVICYVDVGTWEPGRPDQNSFPAGLLGNDVQGWPGERWLDVRPSGPSYAHLQAIMTARFQMCSQKGFDAVEPDNMDSFDGNNPGFPTTASDQATYDEWVASTVHSFGMAVFQKNDPSQAAILEPYFDGALDEQCNEYSECASFQPYLAGGKPVLNAEYDLSTSQFCGADDDAGIMGAVYGLNLDGSEYQPCWSGNPGFTSLTSSPLPTAPSIRATPPSTRVPVSIDEARVSIDSGELRLRAGAVAVKISCRSAKSACQGTLAVVVSGRAHTGLSLGRGKLDVPANHTVLIRLTLSPKSLRRLGTARSVRVMTTAVIREAGSRAASAGRSVTLYLPAARRR